MTRLVWSDYFDNDREANTGVNMNNYGMPSTYDNWKLASPPDLGECCEECFVTSRDNGYGNAEPEGCGDEDCQCHATDDGDAGYDAWKDDQLTEG